MPVKNFPKNKLENFDPRVTWENSFRLRGRVGLFTQDLRSCHVSRMKIERKQTTEASVNEKFIQLSLCSKKQRRTIFNPRR